MIEIRPCTVAEIEQSNLAEEYATHRLDGLPNPAPQWEKYRALEASGMLALLGAYKGDRLIGFASALCNMSLHYGARLTLSESLFVASAHRKTGAGVKLVHALEQLAASNGSSGLLITAQHDSPLTKLLGLKGYRQTHDLLFKAAV